MIVSQGLCLILLGHSLTRSSPQVDTSKVVGILSSKPVTTHPGAGKEVSEKDNQVTIDGKNYWICHDQGLALLIDPDSLNETFTNQLIEDLRRARQALEKRESDFSIIKSCPALLDLVLRTIDRKSTGGLGDVVMLPQLSFTLKKEDGTQREFPVTPSTEISPSPVHLTPFDIGNIPNNPLATPILPHQYTISYFQITPSARRRTIEEKLIKTYWDIRYDMDKRYRDAYQNLAAKLSFPVQYRGLISLWKGKSVAELPSDDRSILKEILRQNNQTLEVWQTASVTNVTARLSLAYLNITADGVGHKTTMRLPVGLY